jgi:hypothetical protein
LNIIGTKIPGFHILQKKASENSTVCATARTFHAFGSSPRNPLSNRILNYQSDQNVKLNRKPSTLNDVFNRKVIALGADNNLIDKEMAEHRNVKSKKEI